MNIPIIFEDEYLAAVDKPAGIVVNRSEKAAGETVQDWAEEKFRIQNSEFPPSPHLRQGFGGQARLRRASRIQNEKDFYNRAGIVHRLDKDSSGLLLIAKTAEVFFELQRQFKEKKITKIYKALVHGDLKGEGVINVPVGRLPWNRRRFGVLADGREAVTEYKAIEEFRTNTESYTLLEVKPATGRTHQIRVHLKHLGYSLVGDSLYSGNKTLAMDRQFCPRLFLHASVLGFRHPIKNNHVVITSDFPQELRKVIAFVSKSVKST